jgi:hypothetical protein
MEGAMRKRQYTLSGEEIQEQAAGPRVTAFQGAFANVGSISGGLRLCWTQVTMSVPLGSTISRCFSRVNK